MSDTAEAPERPDALTVAVITASDSCNAGLTVDDTTPRLCARLADSGLNVVSSTLVADDVAALQHALRTAVDELKVNLVLTTGGTGIGPRDVTPEATRGVIECDVPGIAELMRAESARITPHAWLSRAIAGTRAQTLIINLPGSPKAADECAQIVLPLVDHAMRVMGGADHRTPKAAAT